MFLGNMTRSFYGLINFSVNVEEEIIVREHFVTSNVTGKKKWNETFHYMLFLEDFN